MAVYNGEPWLEQQVATIWAQSLRPQRLLVLNDGSSDGSAALLAALQGRYGGWLQQLPAQTPGANRGCIATFGRLLAATTAPYVALADQDDLWDANKLELSLQVLQTAARQAAAAAPLLLYTDARCIDAHGQLLHRSWLQREGRAGTPRNLQQLAACNPVMGCTVVLNRACLEAALPIPPQALMHDWWLALVASNRGGLMHWPEPSLSYRSHGANQSRPARWWQWPARTVAVWRQWCACCRRQERPITWGDPLQLVWQRLLG